MKYETMVLDGLRSLQEALVGMDGRLYRVLHFSRCFGNQVVVDLFPKGHGIFRMKPVVILGVICFQFAGHYNS